jgi:hypothetical protein
VSINITNDMLVTQPQSVSTDGSITTNTSSAEIMVFPFDVKQRVPQIGRQFFAAAQLLVDFEGGNFTIWPVQDSSESNLVPIGSGCATKSVRASNTTSSSANDTAGGDSSTNGHKGSGLTNGAIAGVVVGAVAGVALIIAVIFILMRRRKWMGAPEQTSEGVVHQGNTEMPPGHEVEATSLPQELNGVREIPELNASQQMLELQAAREAGELEASQKASELASKPASPHDQRHEIEGSQK